MRRQYNTDKSMKARLALLLAVLIVIAVGIGYLLGSGGYAEDVQIPCWVMCKTYVNIREKPDENSGKIGYLDAGDQFWTDAESKNGFIRSYGVGDGAGWVYCGYVVTEKPEMIGERYVCVANRQVACRKWIHGPQIEGRGAWLRNGQTCQVICIADGWALTNRGYIQTEWLEADPE